MTLKAKTMRQTAIKHVLCGITVACFGMASPAIANDQVVQVQFIEDVGGSQRIDFAGKLRMLSQRVVAAACYVQSGVEVENTRQMLLGATNEFSLITQALEFGNPDLGINGAEERRRTIVGLTKLNGLFEPISALAGKIADGDGTIDDVASMADQSGPLLELAKRMVSEISGQYSDPTALLQADAIVIDIAGRQRMLSQRMSKNTCLLTNGIGVERAQAELEGASQMFDVSLYALRTGLADAGIKEPPTPEIEAGLDVVIAEWEGLQPIVDSALEGRPADAEQMAIMFAGANRMTGGMNTVVGMYSEASKLGL